MNTFTTLFLTTLLTFVAVGFVVATAEKPWSSAPNTPPVQNEGNNVKNGNINIFEFLLQKFSKLDPLSRTNKAIRKPAGRSKQNNEEVCPFPFEGFGVHLGSVGHFNRSSLSVIEQVTDKLYNDLNLRYYRTSYEPTFSPSDGEYDISCQDMFSCTWNSVHDIMNKYPGVKYFASIWSPPYYMKNRWFQLLPTYEQKFYFFVKNVTQLIKERFNQTIELVSLVNEPENAFAPWDHCNMDAGQLCGMVRDFNDTLISGCPENSYLTTTNIYMSYNLAGINCREVCKVVLTHGYFLNIDPLSPNFLTAYYDMYEHTSTYKNVPVWQTEVSSTYENAIGTQMKEALDFAIHIVRFVGTTCVTRYYYWSAFTMGSSGESLMWGNAQGVLTYPTKYFVYRHFTAAAHESPNKIAKRCDGVFFPGPCLQFGNETAIFVNFEDSAALTTFDCDDLCCTTEADDYSCGHGTIAPPESVCSCKVKTEDPGPGAGALNKESKVILIVAVIFASVFALYY